jgi:hypothetical protein
VTIVPDEAISSRWTLICQSLNVSQKRSFQLLFAIHLAGIQGHTMFIDINGNAEANYTVVSLQPDNDDTSSPYRRSLQPVGSFVTHGSKLPVSQCASSLTVD